MFSDAKPPLKDTTELLSILGTTNFKVTVASMVRQGFGHACASGLWNVHENKSTAKVYNAHFSSSLIRGFDDEQ